MEKKYFIDPKMSLVEVKNLLKETVFSTDNIKRVQNIVNNNLDWYEEQNTLWLEECKNDVFQIFTPFQPRSKYPVRLIALPYYSRNSSKIDIMFYARIRFQTYNFVTALINNNVELFDRHSVKRFEERVLDRFIPKLDDITIGKMLIRNNMTWICNYNEDGYREKYSIARDGFYACSYLKGGWYNKTIITPDMFSPAQHRFYNAQLLQLNSELTKMGVPTIDRKTRYEISRNLVA